ncbi:MAG: phasin superfamily protein [Desulfuromonas sp.]|nr:MAG: phasin superfamily protein [Desulfuromonas sp.]
MFELIEKAALTAMGAVALSQKKAEELLGDLKSRYDMTEEEGKEFLNKLQDAAKQNQEKLEEMAQEEVKKTCERMGVVTQDEFAKLQKKVQQLEKKLKELSS